MTKLYMKSAAKLCKGSKICVILWSLPKVNKVVLESGSKSSLKSVQKHEFYNNKFSIYALHMHTFSYSISFYANELLISYWLQTT